MELGEVEGLFLFLLGLDGGMGVMFVVIGFEGVGGCRMGVMGVLKRKLFLFSHFFSALDWTMREIFICSFLFLGFKVRIHFFRAMGIYPVSPSEEGKLVSSNSSLFRGDF